MVNIRHIKYSNDPKQRIKLATIGQLTKNKKNATLKLIY